MQLGESTIAKCPVGQQLRKRRNEVKIATSAERIGIQESGNHDSSTIGLDVGSAIMCHCHLAETRQSITEAIKDRRGITTVSIAHALESRGNGNGGHVKRTRLGGRLACVHILNAARTTLHARGIKVYLQVASRFEGGTYLQVGSLIGYCWCGNAISHNQPPVFQCLVNIGIARKAKGEAQARSHHITFALSKEIANIGCEARQSHRILIAIANTNRAHHHQQTSSTLSRLIPPLILQWWLGGHCQLDDRSILVLDKNLILVNHLIFNRIKTSVARVCCDDQSFRLLVMGYCEGGVRTKGQLFLESVLVLGERCLWACFAIFTSITGLTCRTSFTSITRFLHLLRYGLAETLVRLLEEGEVVVKRLHIEVTVDVQLTIVRNGITQAGTIGQLCSTHPVISSIIRGIGSHPVEDGQLIQRQLIRCREGLAIVERTSEVLDALPYRILPGTIMVWIKVLVDGQVAQGLFYLSLRARLEIHVEVAGKVPAQGEATIPQELRIEDDGKLGTTKVGHVTLLRLIIEAHQLRIEGNTLRQPVQGQRLGEVHPFRLALRLLKRFPCFIDGRIAVVQRTTPLVFLIINGCLARGLTMRMTIREGEVGRVVRHGVTLGLDTKAHIRQREVGIGCLGNRYALDGVAFVTIHYLQGIVQFQVGVQRVILRTGFLLRHRVIKRCCHLHLVGEELTQLHAGGQRVSLVVVLRTGSNTIFQTTKSFRDNLTRQVNRSHIGKLDVQGTRSSPSSMTDNIQQAQLVHPYLTRANGTIKVAHTYHHGLHLAQRRITHNAYLIIRMVWVVVRIEHVIAACTQ